MPPSREETRLPAPWANNARSASSCKGAPTGGTLRALATDCTVTSRASAKAGPTNAPKWTSWGSEGAVHWKATSPIRARACSPRLQPSDSESSVAAPSTISAPGSRRSIRRTINTAIGTPIASPSARGPASVSARAASTKTGQLFGANPPGCGLGARPGASSGTRRRAISRPAPVAKPITTLSERKRLTRPTPTRPNATSIPPVSSPVASTDSMGTRPVLATTGATTDKPSTRAVGLVGPVTRCGLEPKRAATAHGSAAAISPIWGGNPATSA